LSTQNCDSGEGDFFIEPVVSNLIDDVDKFSNIFEQVCFEELSFA